MKSVPITTFLFTLAISLGTTVEGQEATPRRQPGATMTVYEPEQHDLYDGRFVLSAGRVYQVGGLEDQPGWEHIGNDATNVHPIEGTVDIAIWLTVRSVLLDTAAHGHIPVNDGLVRPIHIVAPEGCLANPKFPAPTIARFCPGNQLADTVMKALAQVAPTQVSAGIGNLRVISFSGLQNSEHWVHMEIFEGSYGGRYGKDGMDAVDTLYANTRNNPIEDIESHLPLRVGRYELRENVYGAGKWRGGLGSIREFEYLSDGAAAVEGEGHKFPPWGFDGGNDGQVAGLQLSRVDGSCQDLPSKVPHTALKAGDRFICVGPAGGGYGDAFKRSPELVLDDVLDGLISRESAKRDFGVAITENFVLDQSATAVLRDADSS